MLPQSVLTSVATPHLGHEGLGFIKGKVPKKKSGLKKGPVFEIPILYFFRMGKQPVHIGGKGATDRAVCSPPRGKTCCLEIAKMKRMGYNVFAFKQTSDEGESRRVRYIYASDKETITCRKKLLRRPREERTHADLSAMLDDETVVGAELSSKTRKSPLRSGPMMPCRRRRKRFPTTLERGTMCLCPLCSPTTSAISCRSPS